MEQEVKKRGVEKKNMKTFKNMFFTDKDEISFSAGGGKMTKEEFKEKFKVGDVIQRADGGCTPRRITSIGSDNFLCVRVDSEHSEGVFPIDSAYGWEKVEPKKKPSEEIHEIYLKKLPSRKQIVIPHEIMDAYDTIMFRIESIHEYLDKQKDKV